MFAQSVRATFDAGAGVELQLIRGSIAQSNAASLAAATVVVLDLDPADATELALLDRLMAETAGRLPVIVITPSFDADMARRLLQMRVADFLVKPVPAIDLVRACARVVRAPAVAEAAVDADIYTFLPAVGGAGVTTLAIQTALILNGAVAQARQSTCLVDLNFQHGACADYLDLEPRLDLKEIEPRPERLDRQLLEVMLSRHASGLAVVCAPSRPAEMRTFDPDMVTRLLDLVSANFRYVVIDMPRTWFSWTDSVLLGSNRLFVVSEMTVPGVRHAKQLVAAIRDRLADAPRAQVIINRFEQPMFGSGLRKADVAQALGDDFAFAIPNNYRLVREAIDRGVPLEEVKRGNNITQQLRKLVIARPEKNSAPPAGGIVRRVAHSLAR
ncbi:MAG: response regulator receiver protein [Proteobacteria bacterium]|nr:response regulator receiver protein [Pseudomonadota bacterium]